MINRRMFVLGGIGAAAAAATAAAGEAPAVRLLQTPNGGIQPQAALDSKGVLHLVYYRGDAKAGDLFYTRMAPGAEQFAPALPVNTHPGSAISMGTIRGAQIAIGAGDRVHVAWNGSDRAEPKGPGGNPMLTTRMNAAGTAFEPERNLITWAGGLDGGGTIAASESGDVYVAWHANPKQDGEQNRAVYLSRSTDNGATFDRERRINTAPTGVCGCCALRAHVDRDHRVYVFYRSATNLVNRDMIMLRSADRGETFQAESVHPWNINACPMSSSSMTDAARGIRAAWETKEQVYFADIDGGGSRSAPQAAPAGGSGQRKHPVIVTAGSGETLLAWTEGTGWSRGGSLAWQVYAPNGSPTPQRGRQSGVPAWSLLTAVPGPGRGFTLIY